MLDNLIHLKAFEKQTINEIKAKNITLKLSTICRKKNSSPALRIYVLEILKLTQLNRWVLTPMMLLDATVFLLKTTLAIPISAIAILLPNANVTITKDIFRLLHV